MMSSQTSTMYFSMSIFLLDYHKLIFLTIFHGDNLAITWIDKSFGIPLSFCLRFGKLNTILPVFFMTISILYSRKTTKTMSLTILIIKLITISLIYGRKTTKTMKLSFLIVLLITISIFNSRKTTETVILSFLILPVNDILINL